MKKHGRALEQSGNALGQSSNLEGAFGVFATVTVQGSEDDLRGKNISEETLLPLVELSLRRNGIRIVNESKYKSGSPVLHLNVHFSVILLAWHVLIDVRERSLLSSRTARDPRKRLSSAIGSLRVTDCTIWNSSTLGQSVSFEAAAEVVRSGVESFANDYLKANPK